MASLWMLHGTGVQVKCIGHVLEGEGWIDLKSLLVTFFSLPWASSQPGLSISYLNLLFFNGLYFIWIAKPALILFENSSVDTTSEQDEIAMFKGDELITQAHIFIVLPHKTSKLCKHSFTVKKSSRALTYPQNKTNRIHLLRLRHVERRMLEGLTGQAVENAWQKQTFLLSNSIPVQTVPPFSWFHSPHGRYCVTSNSLVGIKELEHRRRLWDSCCSPLHSYFTVPPYTLLYTCRVCLSAYTHQICGSAWGLQPSL